MPVYGARVHPTLFSLSDLKKYTEPVEVFRIFFKIPFHTIIELQMDDISPYGATNKWECYYYFQCSDHCANIGNLQMKQNILVDTRVSHPLFFL